MIGKRDRCYLCGRNGSGDRLDRHHIFAGVANRPVSEEYDLVVFLCHSRCHENGKFAVHRNRDTDLMLKRDAQRWAMAEYGWTEDDFRQKLGKSWLNED